jgi:hypothetical protein
MASFLPARTVQPVQRLGGSLTGINGWANMLDLLSGGFSSMFDHNRSFYPQRREENSMAGEERASRGSRWMIT